MSDVKNLWSIEQSAERLGVSPFTIRRLVNAGELRSVNIGARRMVLLSELERCEQFGIGKPRRRARSKNQFMKTRAKTVLAN